MKTQIGAIFGKVLFEYECENNTIKKTVEKAIKESADLRSAYLRSADLEGADLRSAKLEGADLEGADLRSADLEDADLRSAYLRSADLEGADLRSANLEGADLRSANLEGADLRSANLEGAKLYGSDLEGAENLNTAYLPIYCKWNHSVLGDRIVIGCKQKTIEEWEVFFNSSEEYSTKRTTIEFKQIQAVYLAYKAYLTHLL